MQDSGWPFLKFHDTFFLTSVYEVAQRFQKKHNELLRDIDNIIRNSPKSFHGLNFGRMLIEVKIGNGATRKDPAYRLTRDAFMLLAMGFTGKAAIQRFGGLLKKIVRSCHNGIAAV